MCSFVKLLGIRTCICIRVCAHVHTCVYWAVLPLQVSLKPPLQPSSGCALLSTRRGVPSSIWSSKQQGPLHSLANSPLGPFFRAGCAAPQGGGGGPKTVTWRRELGPEGRRKGTKRAGQDALLTLPIPAQRILSSNPPGRVGGREQLGTRGCPLDQTGAAQWPWNSVPGWWGQEEAMGRRERAPPSKEEKRGGHWREGCRAPSPHPPTWPSRQSLQLSRLNDSLSVKDQISFKFALSSVIWYQWFYTRLSLFLFKVHLSRVSWYVLSNSLLPWFTTFK